MSMEIHLIPDKTFFAQAAIFIVVLFSLTRLVFRPLQRIFLLRKNRTTSLTDEAKKIDAEAKKGADSYTRVMDKAMSEAREEKDRLVQEGLNTEAEIKTVAKKEALKIIAEAEAKALKAKRDAAVLIEKEVPRLANEIIGKIMQ